MTSTEKAIQVTDDPELLEMILQDHDAAPSEFLPTARWKGYSDNFVRFLRNEGLRDFRGRKLSKDHDGFVLARFGAVDINVGDMTSPGRAPLDLYQRARAEFLGPDAVEIGDIPASRVGNPQGFDVEGRFFTLSWINYYFRYAYVSRQLGEFGNKTIVEVGPGSGKQAEMLKRAHPDLTIILFDLPAQLYVCNQYLTKVFEGTNQVAGYRELRSIKDFSEIHAGKINILPNWKSSIIEGNSFDLFWNSASLQEMGPEEATKYLKRAQGIFSFLDAQHQVC